MYLVTADEMQRMDRETIRSFGLPGRLLMENAGKGAAQIFLKTFGGLSHQTVGVVAGRGNNGGDGFVIARYLAQQGINVTVYLLSKKSRVTGDAAANLKLLHSHDIRLFEIPDQAGFAARKNTMKHQDIWVDAIFGTGLNADITGYYKKVIDFINRLNKPVFSVDIPSGLNSDTGRPCGTSIRAHTTATFAFAKIGQVVHPGVTYTGKLEIVDIGIPPAVVSKNRPLQQLITADMVSKNIKPRPADAHKGDTGHLLVIAGSEGKTGAAAMTAMSAMRCGAGLVTAGIPESLNPVMETLMLEAMTAPLPETSQRTLAAAAFEKIMALIDGKSCLALGPGLAVNDETKSLVRQIVLSCPVPMVIDADGLNCLSGNVTILQKSKAPVVLTPHPGEMARLINVSTRRIQENRVENARRLARSCQAHIVLKGSKTVVAHPDGRVFVNPSGNAGMASGGMGDILTGIIAGFITQGYAPETASHIGTYLHGATADYLAETYGPVGFIASDVMHAIPAQLGRLSSPKSDSSQ